jgi:signal transduction histidine kinase
MQIEIPPDQMAFLFPAYMIVDKQLVLQEFAPSLSQCECPPVVGRNLLEYFHLPDQAADIAAAIAMVATIAKRMDYLQLHCVNGQYVLAGTAIRLAEGYLLAVNRLPTSSPVSDADSADAPSDASMPALKLVSIQKVLLEEARQTAADLVAERQRSEDMLTRFRQVSGYMAHDFNNLLSVVRLNVDVLMKQRGLSQKVSSRLKIMAEVAERGSEITHSLMTLARQKHDTCLPLNVDEHIDSNRAFFATSIGASHKIVFNLGAKGAFAEVGRTDLTNCLLNLVINARDAMADDGMVTISTSLVDAPLVGTDPVEIPASGEFIAIRISDTGHGMSKEVVERAFEPFFSTKQHGTGVGLASVREFARAMGGDATVVSSVNKGTTINVFLPLCDAAPVILAVQQQAHSTALAAQESGAGCGLRILVVEDEVHALAALTELLEEEDFLVTPAADYDEAMASLGEQSFDLLLADVVLPHSNGIALAGHASDMQPDLHVIMMSGYAPNADEMSPDWLFLRKPLDLAKLLKMIRTAVPVG